MNNKQALGIIAAIVVVGIGGIVAFAMIQNDTNNADGHVTHSHSDEENAAENNGSSGSSSSSEAEATDTAEIKDYAFQPGTITVKVGTKVTWTNKDDVKHNVKTEDGAPEAIDGELIGKGESYSYTFTKAGTYNYFCEPHPYMKGVVVVTDA